MLNLVLVCNDMGGNNRIFRLKFFDDFFKSSFDFQADFICPKNRLLPIPNTNSRIFMLPIINFQTSRQELVFLKALRDKIQS